MTTEVLIPYRDAPDRRYALEAVMDHLTLHGWEFVIGKDQSKVWNKGKVVHKLVAESSADIVVIHDADVICEPGWLRRAVQSLTEHAWAIPHDKVYRLNKEISHNFCEHCVWNGVRNPRFEEHLVRPSYSGIYGGGIVVLPRETYLDTPLDSRFEGFGQEDESWGIALETMHGPCWRGDGKLMHLWHEPQPRVTNRWGSESSRRRYQEEYHCWNGNQVEMRKTIERAKLHLLDKL